MTRRWFALGTALLIVSCGTEPSPRAVAPTEDHAPSEVGAPTFEGLDGFWSTERAEALLEHVSYFEVQADTSGLRDGEREALPLLMQVGAILHRLYERSRHPQAEAVSAHLAAYSPAEGERLQLEALRSLYRSAAGPFVVDLEGERVPFAPVTPGYEPGRNVYPVGLAQEAFDAYLEAHPEQRALTAVRSVVRRRDALTLEADRATLGRHAWLAPLHPGLEARLEAEPDDDALYAVPYALAYADDVLEASGLLQRAAALVRPDDEDLADYLEQRARDLLSDDYEGGDAAWVSGRFQRLNAQLGAYETYDDHLMGRKAFFGASILVRHPEASQELEAAVAQLADFEAALPGGPYQRVRSEIPIGIYDVHADFGQARGANTASILPNEAHIIAKYGRVILVRRNMLMAPAVLESAQARFRAAVSDAHAEDLGPRGNFDRTVWHEVGHYLGPKRTADGRVVTEALGQWHNHIEELKADLVSLWLMPRLEALGVIDAERRVDAYAAGVLRALVTREPSRNETYATMRVMQQNYLIEHAVLTPSSDGRLTIDYARYPAAVLAMLTEVLAIQRAGDADAAEAFIERWARWDDAVQGVLGRATDAVAARYRVPLYAAFDETAE